MTKNFFAIQVVFALLGSVSANAANLRQDRILVQESIRHAENFSRPGEAALRKAEDKLTFVQRDIRDLRDSNHKMRLERSLDEAIRSLMDRRLSDRQKSNDVIRHGNDALVSIDALERSDNSSGARRELDSAVSELDRVVRVVRDRRMMEAERIVRDVQISLNRFGRADRDLEDASRELDRLSRLLGDRYLNPRQLEDLSARSVRAASDLILRSRTYREGGRDNNDGRDELGRTGRIGIRSTTDVIQVGRHEGRFVGLEIKAKEADIRLDSIEVVFGNGRSEIFRGGFILQGETLRLDVRGQERAISSIMIRAQTMARGARGDEGFLIVRGLR